jgi:hypothetical protein
MADAVTSQTIFDGERMAVMKFTNVSDGTGETGVLKVDVSALNPNVLGQACDGVTLERIHCSINGMSVSILWDATTDVPAFIAAPGVYTFDFTKIQLPNNAGTGVTGDVLFTTIGASASDTYTIVLEMVKSYAA